MPNEVIEETGSTFDLINDVEEDEKLDLSEKEEKPSEEVTEEKEEKDEIELDEDEIEKEDEEEIDVRPFPTRKEILAAFPELYKKFPQLNNAFYRERQFTELIGDPNDAKELIAKAKSLDNFESYLSSGETEKILLGIKQTSPEAFAKVVDNYLSTLAKVDNDAYSVVVGNTIKHTIAAMALHAKRKGDDDLRKAAELLNEFVFASSEFEPPVRLSKGEEKKDDTISRREQELRTREFNSAKDSLNTKVDNVLRSTIDAYIDPRDSMSSYVRKNAVREVLESLPEIMQGDSRFQTLLTSLWERAYRDNYSEASKDRIKSAYLNKAKTVLPAVIKKVRAEALKGLGRKERSESDEESTPNKRGPAPVGKTASSSSSGKSFKEKARVIPAGMTTKDYLLAED